VQIDHLSQLLSKILGGKVVNERIEAAIHAAETERQLVGHVERLVVEEPQHRVSQQEDVVRREAEGEHQENDEGQKDGSSFLGRLGISGQFAYDADVAEGRDAEGEEEEHEHHAEEEGRPGRLGREHVFLQHVEARGDPQFGNVKGQVRGHQRPQDAQDHAPHEEAAEDGDGLLDPGLPELHGPDDAQVAVDSDGHHGQNGAVHVGVEDNGHDSVGGYGEEESFFYLERWMKQKER